MKMSVDRKKFVSYTRKGLICFSKTCCRSAREHPSIVGIAVFFLLLYVFLPVVFFFLASHSPVIVCTAILLGTLLSFGQPYIPEVILEREETTQEISSLKVMGASNNLIIEKDGNSEARIPLLTEERQAINKIEEDAVQERSLGVEKRELIDGSSSEDEEKEKEEESDEEKEIRSTPVFNVETQKDAKIIDTDETELSFTPRDTSRKEEMQLARAHLDRGDHVHKTFDASKFDEREDSGNKSKFYCRSNSRRTVRFAMHDPVEAKEEKRIKEEESDEESKRIDEELLDQEKIPDAQMEDCFSSTLGSPWLRIDQLSKIDHDDQFSHSSSEHAESSSSDASMADIIPLLDELNPLLDSETPQPNPVEPSDGKSEESENQSNYSGEEEDEDDNSIEGGEEGHGVGEEEEGHKEMKGVTWTEDDTKNVMDLGSSELERNQRLENLMAKRRARRNQHAEVKDLIDLQPNEKNLLFENDSALNSLTESSVPPHTSPFLFRSTTLPMKRNPFDLPYDGEGESLELSPPSSARLPSASSTRRNPFDLPYDHADVDHLLAGEASSHGEFVTTLHKGLSSDGTHLLGRSSFEGEHEEKGDEVNNIISLYNLPIVESVTGSEFISSFHFNNVGETQKQETRNVESSSLITSFDGLPKALEEENMQKVYLDEAMLREGMIPCDVEKGTVASQMRSSVQTGSISSMIAHESRDNPDFLAAITESSTISAEVHASVESTESEPSSTDSESHSSDEAEHAELTEAQVFIKSVSAELTEEHMDYETVSSPEHVVFPLDVSPSKRFAGSDIVEEKVDNSSYASSSLEVEETKLNASSDAENPLCIDSQITHLEETGFLKEDPVESQIFEPVFDSSPLAHEKLHSGFSSISESELSVEKGDRCDSGMVVDKSIILECGEKSATDGESKALDEPSVKVLAQRHSGKDTPNSKEVLDILASADQNVRVIQVESSSVVAESTGMESVHVADSSELLSHSPRDHHLTIKDARRLGDDIQTVQSEEREVSVHVDWPPSSVEGRLDGVVDQSDELAAHSSLVGEHVVFEASYSYCIPSSLENGVSSEIIQGEVTTEPRGHDHVSSTVISEREIVDEETKISETTPPDYFPGNDERTISNDTGISKEYVGDDHDVWVMKEEEVECIKDLDEDLLVELDTIGDFRIVNDIPMVHDHTEKQLSEHTHVHSEEGAQIDSSTHIAVVDAQSVEDISVALRLFCTGESSKVDEWQLVGHEKDATEHVSSYNDREVRQDHSELVVVEAQSLDDIHSALKQISGGDSQIHVHGLMEDIENRENEVEVEIDACPAIVEVDSSKEREICGDTEEERHGSELRREEESKGLDDSSPKDNKSKHKRTSSSSSSSSDSD